MRPWPILAAAAGMAATVALVGYFGADSVVRSLFAIGGTGFIAICAMHLGLIAVMGLAWRVLLPGADLRKVIWARMVRDSGSEVLPLSQVGGYVLGARALALAGVPGTLAAASTIVDVTLEFVAQLAYTALGLFWLVRLQPDTEAAPAVLFGLAAAAVAAVAFIVAQRRGFSYFERIVRILGSGWAERTAAGAAALHDALAGIYRHRGRLGVSCTLHLACWIASTAEVWLVLRIAGEPLPFTAALAIESLLYAIRTAAFAVPQAIGVQEGAYILLGAGFGLTPDMALALSLVKRGRDLAIGVPVIAVWQAIESNRLRRRRGAARAGAMPAPRDWTAR